MCTIEIKEEYNTLKYFLFDLLISILHQIQYRYMTLTD